MWETQLREVSSLLDPSSFDSKENTYDQIIFFFATSL